MKYILRTLWVIGAIPVYITMAICFLLMVIIYPLAIAFYFIKTGNDNIPFGPDIISEKIGEVYEKLLELIENVH